MKVPSFRLLSDAALAATLAGLVERDRHSTVALVASIEEFDSRRLFLPAGFPSTFAYCTQRLHMSEGAAYSRIEAARAARRFPVILEHLASGFVTLATVGLIARHLNEGNCETLLSEVRHRSKRDVEIIVARLRPKPDVPALIRKVASPSAPPPPTPPPPVSRPVIAPLAPERFKLQVTMSQETHDTLRQLQNLMRHSIPSGDAALIVERALKLLLNDVLRRKCGMRKRDLPALDPEQQEIGGHDRLIH